MSEYTKQLSAEELIAWLASDYMELSHDKVLIQRNEHMNVCREWLEHNIWSKCNDAANSNEESNL